MKSRPVGITLVSLLNISGGLIMIYLLLANKTDISRVFGNNYIIVYLIIVVAVALYLIQVIAGMKLLTGNYWSWYVVTTLQIISLLNKIAQVMIKLIYHTDTGMLNFRTPDLLTIFLSAAIIEYLLQNKVREFFSADTLPKKKYITILLSQGVISITYVTLINVVRMYMHY